MTKKLAGIVISAAILFIAWYGNYLPLAKSQAFIDTLRNMSVVRSIDDFKTMLARPLDMASPIGQEELVRNSANNVMAILRQTNDPQIISQLIEYISGYYAPIVARGRGMSFEQDLYILGTMNEMAFAKTRELQYLQDAKKYYEQGFALGPKRPQPLYGLFDVYRTEGNVEASVKIANQILSQWPNDAKALAGLNQFLDYIASSTKKK
ncbi:MAG: hypothetical protein Q8P49_04535 [Candidatus Liptonbacteria bacterium]|nr:hypothetical protein [Candidatus Liptonbacteria bacterium]